MDYAERMREAPTDLRTPTPAEQRALALELERENQSADDIILCGLPVQIMMTTIPCPDSNTLGGECIGSLNARRRGSEHAPYWEFFCNECGRTAGIGTIFREQE